MGKEKLSISDRYKGSLVGVAVGDALGQPVEGILREEEIQKMEENFGKGRWSQTARLFQKELEEQYGGVVREMLRNPYEYWQKGEYTDDTTQTLLLVDSLIEKDTYDPEDFVNRLLQWFNHGTARGLGTTSKMSLSLIEAGTHWRDAGHQALEKGAFASNGSLMRTSPVGLYFRGHPDTIDRVASELSIITHAAKPAIEACQLASQLISYLASGVTKDEAMDLIQNRYSAFYKVITSETVPTLEYPGGALESLSIALIAFTNANDFEEAIVTAINQGGDTDTNASITGAFAGAYWGINQVPTRWSKEINPLSAKQIESKAEHLYSLNKQLDTKI